jgi:predicted nuclease with TOPRIM domain
MISYTDYTGITLAETQRQLLVARKSSISQSKHLAQALKEKNDLLALQGGQLRSDKAALESLVRYYEGALKRSQMDLSALQIRYDELLRKSNENSVIHDLWRNAKPKFRVGQYVVALTNNSKWDSVNGEPYRIDKAVVRITSVTTNIFPKGSPFCYSHNGKEGDYSIPEVWFRALRPEEI